MQNAPVTDCKKISCESCGGRTANTIFCSLSPEALSIVNTSKSVHSYKRGQYVFHAGSFPKGLYCVNSGVVRLENDGKSGNSHIYRIVSQGGVLGYRSLFANDAYQSSALVQEDATICFIPKSSVDALLRKFPEVGVSFLSLVATQLRVAETRHANLVDKEAPRRIAEIILHLHENFPEIQWTRKEISELADTRPETVMRCLADFKKLGFIDFEGRKIEIKNKTAFVRYADLDAA